MTLIPQIIFVIVMAIPTYLIVRRIRQIRGNILRGRPLDRNDNSSERWKTMFLIAFGQKKMFKKPIPAFLHLLIYVGFLVINLEVLEFMLDGLLGTHRLFAPYLGDFYNVAMNFFEFLALGVLISCVVFLIRRNVIKVPRFTKPEMKGWPAMDGNLILIIEIALMIAILKMNAADQVLQSRDVAGYHETGKLMISSFLVPLIDQFDTGLVMLTERGAWWFHIIGIMAFALYVTYSKHLHIFLAFPNTYYSNLEPKGKIQNMDAVTTEVKSMLGMPVEAPPANPDEMGRFGAKDATDLSWKSLMEAYSCTECGRCTAECPANQTGKLLSPRKIMMDTRDRIEEIGNGKEEGKSLLGDYITKEEINACTSCNACTEACPVNIDPLAIILEMKRYVAMEESGSPASWNAMFANIETNFAPWKFAPSDRFKWAEDLKND
ncbi:(Fe-S)-binding protein [Reichenbachiella ulvae]|uniref:(Fe-S)-binding protein n=1 Tax=Reichenbachiella ulvae TaxID=2980104 RepID=A0ABT3CYD8_9BACT|nr:(Fe-S)-binding protein [Reichenbachiella ulvae]MCV9388715.1 (Fe-S)-binding protein [Reichenbachiella ulvae]